MNISCNLARRGVIKLFYKSFQIFLCPNILCVISRARLFLLLGILSYGSIPSSPTTSDVFSILIFSIYMFSSSSLYILYSSSVIPFYLYFIYIPYFRYFFCASRNLVSFIFYCDDLFPSSSFYSSCYSITFHSRILFECL